MPRPRQLDSSWRTALTLLEVMLAGLVLSLAIIPSMGLISSSSTEISKVRSRIIAVNLGASMIEEMRSRPAPARADLGPVPADQLPQFTGILQAYRDSNPPAISLANVEKLLGNYTSCSVTRGSAVPLAIPPATVPRLRAEVGWTTAGRPYSFTSEGWLGTAP